MRDPKLKVDVTVKCISFEILEVEWLKFNSPILFKDCRVYNLVWTGLSHAYAIAEKLRNFV